MVLIRGQWIIERIDDPAFSIDSNCEGSRLKVVVHENRYLS